MDLFTNRAPSAPEDFVEETRNVLLPVQRGRDGRPSVVRIRRLSLSELHGIRPESELGENQTAAKIDESRAWAESAIVEPAFSFNGTGGPPHWDRLPMADQITIVEAIATFSMEGTQVAARHRASFRGGEPDGGAAGGPSRGSTDSGENGAGEQATSDTGAIVASIRRPRGRPRRSSGSTQT